jgi:rhamnogalacturonan endolyase
MTPQLIYLLVNHQVFFNDQNRSVPHFGTGLIGRDNAIARHGIHGLYWLFNIDVNSVWLVQGVNTIYLKQARSQSPFQGLMYDYLRLEGPCGCQSIVQQNLLNV